MKLANSYHLTIKFTAEFSDREITFLDTCVYDEKIKKESILDVRTHFKPTETFQLIYKLHLLPPIRRQERPDQRRSLNLLEKLHLKKTLHNSNAD